MSSCVVSSKYGSSFSWKLFLTTLCCHKVGTTKSSCVQFNNSRTLCTYAASWNWNYTKVKLRAWAYLIQMEKHTYAIFQETQMYRHINICFHCANSNRLSPCKQLTMRTACIELDKWYSLHNSHTINYMYKRTNIGHAEHVSYTVRN